MTAEEIVQLRAHPNFRTVVEAYAASNLIRYRALPMLERWLVRDIGCAALSAACVILEGLNRLTPAELLSSWPVVNGQVSRGRARLYLQRAMANALILSTDPARPADPSAPLRLSPTFRTATSGIVTGSLQAAEDLGLPVAEARRRLREPVFRSRLSVAMGFVFASSHALFPPDSPIRLFQSRDGGSRMLEALIIAQPDERPRLLTRCAVTHSGLARAGACSRAHVIRLLRDGGESGLLRQEGRELHFAPALSDDAERYFAAAFLVTALGAEAAAQEV